MKLSDLRKFDPNQPRDDHGRWSSTGRAAVVAGAAAVGAAAGVAGGAKAVRGLRAAMEQHARQGVREIRTVGDRNFARQARHAATAKAIKKQLNQVRDRAQETASAQAVGRATTAVMNPKGKVTAQREVAAQGRLRQAVRAFDRDFLGTVSRNLRSQANRAGAEVRQHMAEHSQPFWSPDDPERMVWASTDSAGEQALRGRAKGLRDQLTHLQETWRAPLRQTVRNTVKTPKVETYEQKRKGKRIFEWVDPLYQEKSTRGRAPKAKKGSRPDGISQIKGESKADYTARLVAAEKARQDATFERYKERLNDAASRGGTKDALDVRPAKLKSGGRSSTRRDAGRAYVQRILDEAHQHGVSQYGGEIEPFHGPKTVDELEAALRRIPQSGWPGYLSDLGISPPKTFKEKVNRTYRNTVRVPRKPTFRRKIQGSHDGHDLARLRDQVWMDVGARTRGWLERERARAAAAMAPVRPGAKARTRAALTNLSFLTRNRRALLAGAGVAGALAAGGAAWALTRPKKKVEKLAKAAPKDPGEQVYRAGAGVEDSLASRIASTFGGWTRIAGEQLMNRGAALRTTLLTGIEQALRPLDVAASGGAGAEVPAIVTDESGDPITLSMSLDTGSDRVNQYARDYRLKLAGQLADEQMQTIQSVLQDATFNGQSTDVTARLLRQTIGLTPTQAGHVISYRRALTALDPNALNRALRDARFDRTVRRAIDTNAPLSDDQVNKMVDAYQRRYLAYRATTIARTEGLRSANNGHVEAMKAYLDDNPEFTVIKTWMATHDSRTRPDHRDLDGQQQIGLYTPFVAASGDRILWPHHPDAPLRQQVNCRCTIAFTLVPRTRVAHGGFSLAADVPSLAGA